MKYVIKSEQHVKPFSRTRKGKIEQVKEFTRQGREGYPKATHEAAVHQVGKDYGISKKKAREYLQRIGGLKQRVDALRTHSGKFGEPYSAGKTFNYDKMKRLIDSDAFLKKMFNNTPGKDEKIAEVMFNTYVVGDSVMEREYNKGVKGLDVDKQDHLHLVGEPFTGKGRYSHSEDLEIAEQEGIDIPTDLQYISKKTGNWELFDEVDFRERTEGPEVVGYEVFGYGKDGTKVIEDHDANDVDERWAETKAAKLQEQLEEIQGEIEKVRKNMKPERPKAYGEPFQVGEKVKVWKGKHEGKEGKVVSTDGFDVKIRHADGTIVVPKREVVSSYPYDLPYEKEIEKAVQVKGFSRVRRGHIEQVKPHSREMQYVIKPGEPFKSKYASDVWGPSVYPMSRRSVRFEEGYKAGRADKLLGISLDIARTSPQKDYSEGYNRGQLETHSIAFKLGQPISVKEQKYIIKQKLNEPGSPTSISGREIAEFSIKDIVGDPTYKDRFPVRPEYEKDEDGITREVTDTGVLEEIAGLVAEHYFPEDAKEKEAELLSFSQDWWKKWRAGNTEEDFNDFDIENFSDELREQVSRKGGLEEPDFWKFAREKIGEPFSSEEAQNWELTIRGLKEKTEEQLKIALERIQKRKNRTEDERKMASLINNEMKMRKEKIGEPLSTEGLASAEEPDEEEAVSPEGGTPETNRKSKEDILEIDEAKTQINRLVDMSNTIIDDKAVKQMKDALSKLEISNDWEFKDYKDLVEFSEGELRDAKVVGYNSVNEYWQAEMPETVTATTSRKVRKSMKLMSIDEVLDLKKGKYDFGDEVPILSRPATELEKATQQVKPFVRTRKGKMERVKGFSRQAPTYSQYEGAVNYAKNIKAMPMEEAVKWAKMAVEFEQAIKAEKETARKAELIYGKQDAKMMREMHLGDAKDLQLVYTLWKREDYEGAYWKAYNMDTAARDNIPLSVWNDIDKYRRENLGEPFKFKAEQKKIADKWESDLGDRLGTIKDKMKNKQPVSKEELNSLIQEAENWRTFKVGEPYKAPKTTPQRKRLESDLHKMGLISGDWDAITQKDNHDGTLTIGVRAIEKYKTPSHIEADVFSEAVSKPVGDMIKVRVKQSTGEIVEVVKEQPLGEPFKTLENTTHEERMEVANTILLQMGGGAGKIKAMTGAKNFLALPSGVSFEFPARKGPNYCKVTLTPMDTYTVEFGRKMGMQKLMSGNFNVEDIYKKGNEYTDVYAEDLKEMFESETGLYLSFTKSVTSGEQFVVGLNKARTQGAKDKQPRKKRGVGEINRENLVGRISEEHGIHPDDMKTIWRKLQKESGYRNRESISEEYGIHPDELSDIKLKLDRMYKSKDGFRMAHGEVGESEKVQAKKEQEESGEEPSQKQKRMSRLAKERKEELAGPKNADADDAGMSFQEAPDTMGEGEV